MLNNKQSINQNFRVYPLYSLLPVAVQIFKKPVLCDLQKDH